jgi:hypothetical protein
MVGSLYANVRKISPGQRLFSSEYLRFVAQEIEPALNELGFILARNPRFSKSNEEYSITRRVLAEYKNNGRRIGFVSAHRKSEYGQLKIDEIEMLLDLKSSDITSEQRRSLRQKLDRFFPKDRFN